MPLVHRCKCIAEANPITWSIKRALGEKKTCFRPSPRVPNIVCAHLISTNHKPESMIN